MSYEAKIDGVNVKVYKNKQLVVTKGGWGSDAAQVLIDGEFVICVKKNGRVKAQAINSIHGGEFGSVDGAKQWIKQQ
jgi:hypothetical protein